MPSATIFLHGKNGFVPHREEMFTTGIAARAQERATVFAVKYFVRSVLMKFLVYRLLRAFESVRFHDFQIVRFLLPYANCRRA
jgi:hypothetical protein